MSQVNIDASNSVDSTATHYMVIFNLYDPTTGRKEHYAVDAGIIQKIIPLESITRIPNTPKHVIGVVNYRGKIVPIVNMKTLLEFPNTEISKCSILIAEIRSTLMGLLVDNIEQVIEIPFEQIDFTSKILDNLPYVRGVAKLSDKLIVILDLEKLFSREEVKENDGE